MRYEHNNNGYRIVFEDERDYLTCRLSYLSVSESNNEMTFEEYAYRSRYTRDGFNILEAEYNAGQTTFDVFCNWESGMSFSEVANSTFPISSLSVKYYSDNRQEQLRMLRVAEQFRISQIEDLLKPIVAASSEEFAREYNGTFLPFDNDYIVEEKKVEIKTDNIGTIFDKIDLD